MYGYRSLWCGKTGSCWFYGQDLKNISSRDYNHLLVIKSTYWWKIFMLMYYMGWETESNTWIHTNVEFNTVMKKLSNHVLGCGHVHFAKPPAADIILLNSEFGLDMRLAGVSNSNTWNRKKVMYQKLPSGIMQKHKNFREITFWRVRIEHSTS